MIEYPPIEELLPHRPPMLLLRSVLSHSPAETRCSALIDEALAVACGGAAPAAFALEIIAQAAAAHHGLCDRQIAGKAVRGLLLGSRRLQMNRRDLPTGIRLIAVAIGGDAPAPAGTLIRFEGWVEAEDGAVLARGDVTVLELT